MNESIFVEALELEMWLLTVIILGVFAFISWLGYRSARNRRALVDSGKLCLYCDSKDVVIDFRGLLCNTCGQTTSQALLDAKGPSDAELREIYKPPNPD